jgi:isopenicillin-N N-acyltransferase-like protein
MKDCNLPIIKYSANETYYQWGLKHGSSFKDEIKELSIIRRALMLKRNPSLEASIPDLAEKQYLNTKEFDFDLSEELRGIADGAELSLEDIIILNNYTDFRDIQLPDEGCSTIQVQNPENLLSGQTWDMHRSAKRFMCIIEVPKTDKNPETLILSLVGCTGLMGINSEKCFIGVNNINTLKAEVGIVWPNLVRKVLKHSTLDQMRECLLEAPVTSGHNYLISSTRGAEHWEITPEFKDLIHAHTENESGSSFHTNHCLGENVKKIEDQNNISVTTHKRFKILEEQINNIKTFDDLKELLQSHEGHPISICSHLENGSNDPSATCGGGIVNMKSNDIIFWRGCPEFDDNYLEHKYIFNEKEKSFKRV